MARIRTVKPEFFRHELLQELEGQYPDLHPMMTYLALWGHCDKNGVFEWRPKRLALDILPFLWKGSAGEAIGTCLVLLRDNGLIEQGEHAGKSYGYIPNFLKHQRLNDKEKKAESKMPEYKDISFICPPGSHPGHTRKAPGPHPESQEVEVEVEGKGTGREQEKEEKETPLPPIVDNSGNGNGGSFLPESVRQRQRAYSPTAEQLEQIKDLTKSLVQKFDREIFDPLTFQARLQNRPSNRMPIEAIIAGLVAVDALGPDLLDASGVLVKNLTAYGNSVAERVKTEWNLAQSEAEHETRKREGAGDLVRDLAAGKGMP